LPRRRLLGAAMATGFPARRRRAGAILRTQPQIEACSAFGSAPCPFPTGLPPRHLPSPARKALGAG